MNHDDYNKTLNDAHKEAEERLAKLNAERAGLPFLPMNSLGLLSTSALSILSEKESFEASLVVFKEAGPNISVAAINFNKPKTQEVIEKLNKANYKIKKYITTNTTLKKMFLYYKDIKPTEETISDALDLKNFDIDKLIGINNLKTSLTETIESKELKKVSTLLSIVFGGAIANGASDIHIETKTSGFVVRYRIDSVLVDILNTSSNSFKLVCSRLKLVSGLKINIRNEAQDGRFSILLKDVAFDARLNSIPGPAGENFVIRLLDPNKIKLTLDKLGINEVLLKEFRKQINKPNGMIVVTGPTGSGKTTTLYAFLNEVASTEKKIITLEDPVEYKIQGIVQTQVESSYSFADGLRAILRQDPDILLVGEVRDREVAEVAINASLTGHIVFTTLHTNDAFGAIPRLVDIGMDPKTLSDSINLVIAQRLVRRLNDTKKVRHVLNDEDRVLIKSIHNSLPEEIKKVNPYSEENIFRAVDDEIDSYKGVIGVYEAFVVDKNVKEHLGDGSSVLRESAKNQGLVNMQQDGILKLINGVTSLEELKRVIGYYER